MIRVFMPTAEVTPTMLDSACGSSEIGTKGLM